MQDPRKLYIETSGALEREGLMKKRGLNWNRRNHESVMS